MILTISDSEEGILNKIKSVLACESTLEVMEITNSEKLPFQGLEIDQLQRSVIKDGKMCIRDRLCTRRMEISNESISVYDLTTK